MSLSGKTTLLDVTDSELLLCAIAAVIREVIKRPRTETAEEKKARKAAVKAERAVRREEKKGTKEAFNSETKRQKRVQGQRVADGGAADIKSGMEGVRRLA